MRWTLTFCYEKTRERMNLPPPFAERFISRSAVLLLAAFIVACAGSETRANTAGVDAPASTGVETDESPEVVPTEEPRPAVDCSQGDCLSCGDTFCPSGSICDLSGDDKGKCLWLSDCAGVPACGCIEKALSKKLDCGESPSGVTIR